MNEPQHAQGRPPTDDVRIPLVEEEVRVGKREVESGRVRVSTRVEEERLNLSETLEHDVVEVERVPVNAEVETAPAPFERDGMLIIPIVEERLVVEKRLVVVEEVRVRRQHRREQVDVPVTRRVMRAEIERGAPEVEPAPPQQDRAVGSMPERGPAPRRPAFEPEAMPERGPPPAAALRSPAAPSARSEPSAPTRSQRSNRTMWILGALALLALLLGIARAMQASEQPAREDTSLSSAAPRGSVPPTLFS